MKTIVKSRTKDINQFTPFYFASVAAGGLKQYYSPRIINKEGFITCLEKKNGNTIPLLVTLF